MTIEKKFNEYGKEQVINNFDQIIKIGDKFIQVRLIETEKFNGEGFTSPMPRARFINPQEDFCYLVTREDLIKLKEKQ
jgi:hypothetical protein